MNKPICLVFGVAIVLIGCRHGRERAVAEAKLGDVRAFAEQVESTCNMLDLDASPAQGSALSRDVDVLEVRVVCSPRKTPLPTIFPPLRATKYPEGRTSELVPVGKSQGSKTVYPEEWVNRPSRLVASDGLDVCVQRNNGKTEVCVAYKSR